MRDEFYTWVQDSAGDAYLGTVKTPLNTYRRPICIYGRRSFGVKCVAST